MNRDCNKKCAVCIGALPGWNIARFEIKFDVANFYYKIGRHYLAYDWIMIRSEKLDVIRSAISSLKLRSICSNVQPVRGVHANPNPIPWTRSCDWYECCAAPGSQETC